MIDLNLTNYRHSFMETAVLETGISDHHKMFFFLIILKQTFTKALPRTICYRDLKTLIKNCSIVTWNSKGQNDCIIYIYIYMYV